ncbi:Fusaric acid resistance protein-like-domain-containing protein [Cokeromyces recurvatus]|uniref:Fusaric acid resistance protein-like-domain-containing protein n=1 Tax=Cokeromyces recurvatus TaxID=90255 RepID=UPI00221FEF0D|nr:Fusaric acid resistance protein-like-domain-containing protein [Cokeromyces recurvatus]KAI7901238.1 Fusaric acid resistance protein-like-domain-containing protein [Cokeromyces recurvatus]
MDESSKRRPHNAIIGSPLSDPGISSLSTSPTSYFIERTQSLDVGFHQDYFDNQLDRSVSNFSEIEVILDDGTTQKRTISLSTIPDEQENNRAKSLKEDDSDSEHTNDTTPLLKSHKESYQATGLNHFNQQQNGDSSSNTTSPSSSDNESDSDEPFFPVQKLNKRKSNYIIENDIGTIGFVSRVKAILSSLCKHLFTTTPRQQLVLKCSFAYFLASLFTFIPSLNALIGNNRTSSHLVATATVFFNPAKTLGGMVEAAAYGWGYVLFAVIICLGSMITTDYFVDRNHYLTAHLISLFVWILGATFTISFLKAHWNKPPVATASSLCFITIFIIVVREGSVNRGDFDTTRIEQITTAVATGTFITVACCILFWPKSAAKKLRKDLESTLSSYRVLLKLLTKTFLLDADLPEFKANRTLQAAIEAHQASFTALQKSLKEAKLEAFWNSDMRGRCEEYDEVIKSVQRLAQHMGGLRSSCGIQFEVMGSEATKRYKQMMSERKKQKYNNNQIRSSSNLISPGLNQDSNNWNVRAGYRRRRLQDQMRKQRKLNMSQTNDRFDQFLLNKKKSAAAVQKESIHHLQNEDNSAILVNFIQTIRPPLKSFAYTCKQTLYHLQTLFAVPSNATSITKDASYHHHKRPSLSILKANLEKAIILFEAAQKQAIKKLYQARIDYIVAKEDKSRKDDKVDIESEAMEAVLGQDIILVYFFVFNMTEFARELITLVEKVEKLNDKASKKLGIWTWLISSIKNRRDRHQTKQYNHHLLNTTPFVPNERHRMNTLHTPVPKTKWHQFILRVWRLFSLFKLQKIRYAIKATIATILLATPAFMESTQNWFRTYRMEWALITLMVVMTPTVGGTNLVSIYRIFSTILGCYTAMVFYMIFPSNMYILPILTWLFSIPNFYLILNHKHGKFGQFTLLAYNLVMLNKYNDRDTNEVPVWVLANQRCFAILVGVIFGLFATAYVWPYEARVELRKGLSDFLLRLAWLYQKLVTIYSDYYPRRHLYEQQRIIRLMEEERPETSSDTQILTFEAQRRLATQSFMDLELGLQRSLLDLQGLLSQTPNEPRLKGAFPVATYRTMLTSCQNIVDRFLSMRSIMFKDAWYEEVQHHDLMSPVCHERKEMVGNVILYFYLLASALRLKTPMPPYFPPARKAWKSLLVQLWNMPIAKSRELLEKDNAYIFYYAYVTLMEDIIRELDKVKLNG